MKNFVILLAFVFAVSFTVSAQSTEKKETKKTVDHSSCSTVKKVVDKVKTSSGDAKIKTSSLTTTGIKNSDTKKMDKKECKEGETSGCCPEMKETKTVSKDQETKDDQKK